MNLVERFIQFNDWPTSRKTFLLMLIAAAAHILLTPLILWLGEKSEVYQSGIIEMPVYVAIGLTTVLALISWLEDRAGREARWSAYLVVILYGGWLAWFLLLMGFIATPLLAWAPLVVILVSLWYDQKIGWFAIVYFACGFVLLASLNMAAVFPFAPVLKVRHVDALNSLFWTLAMLTPFFGFFLYAFLLSQLTVAARNLQSENLARAQKLIRRYTPAQVADRILAGEHGEEFKPERVKLTIFFSDIVGFTQASDQLDPEELADLLNTYLSTMAEIAEKHGATINQFVGDGIMLFFGAPHATDDRDHARRAVSMALEMQHRIAEMNDVWLHHGVRTPFRARMGINTGHASVGDYGSAGRKVYSAVGLQTNLAARIQDHCEPGKVLISDTTWALVKDDFGFEEKGEIDLKGVHYPVRVYEVIGEK